MLLFVLWKFFQHVGKLESSAVAPAVSVFLYLPTLSLVPFMSLLFIYIEWCCCCCCSYVFLPVIRVWDVGLPAVVVVAFASDISFESALLLPIQAEHDAPRRGPHVLGHHLPRRLRGERHLQRAQAKVQVRPRAQEEGQPGLDVKKKRRRQKRNTNCKKMHHRKFRPTCVEKRCKLFHKIARERYKNNTQSSYSFQATGMLSFFLYHDFSESHFRR